MVFVSCLVPGTVLKHFHDTYHAVISKDTTVFRNEVQVMSLEC